jgi:hypothetical protein
MFYGLANQGGTTGNGTFYGLNSSLPAFANLVSTAGKGGAKIGIPGQGFSTASMMKFDGVAAN